MNTSLFPRDPDGFLHVVALSGGKDSTAMAIALREREPHVPHVYVCTPTGDELPEMFAHWRRLGDLLGRSIIPIMGGTLKGVCEEENALPNWRMRFCTRRLKIEPFQAWILQHMPVVSYVGLRADEEGRQGADFGFRGLTQRYPLREWGMGLEDVRKFLSDRCVEIPERTDCASCFFQTIGEWWKLWKNHPDRYADAEAEEKKYGHTFRSPSRDTWPAALADLRVEFENGRLPRGFDPDTTRNATCRACTL